MNYLKFAVLFFFLGIVSANLYGEFSDFSGYCSDINKPASIECAEVFLQANNMANLDSSIYENPFISDAIMKNPSLLEKYSKEVLGGKVELIREVDFYEGAKFSGDGRISLPGKDGASYNYNLKKIPEGSKVKILKENINIEIPKNAKVNSFEGIGLDSASSFELSEGSAFDFRDNSISVVKGKLFVSKTGEFLIPEGSTIGIPNERVFLTNNNKEYLSLDLTKESLSKNSVSMLNEKGIKKIISKVSAKGEYTLDFMEKVEGGYIDSRTETLYGNGKDAQIIFRDLVKGGEVKNYGIVEYGDDSSIHFLKNKNGEYLHSVVRSDGKPILIGKSLDQITVGEGSLSFGDVIKKLPMKSVVNEVKPISLNNVHEEDIENIKKVLAETNYDVKSPFARYVGDIPDKVVVFKEGNNGEILAGEAYASFYKPGESSGLGGSQKSAVGPMISKLIEDGVPVVAGSERLGVPFGNALYEIENPENGKKTVVAVLDRFGSWTLENKPERFFDIVSDSGVPEKLGFSGIPGKPDSYGVKKIRFKYLGPIFG